MSDRNLSPDDLEFADNLDDLNLQFGETGHASPVEKPVAKNDEDSQELFISQIKFSSSDGNAPVRKKKDEWYTLVLGQELGPFPFEELIGMVVDEEVGPDDQIRYGANREWIQASEIAGLFPDAPITADDDDFELGGGAQIQEDKPVSSSGKDSIAVRGGSLNRIVTDSEQTRLKNKQNPRAKKVDVESVAEAVPEPVEAPPELSAEELEEQRKQEVANRLNAWLDDNVKVPEGPAFDDDEEDEEDPIVTPAKAVASAPVSRGPATPPRSTPQFKPPKKQKVKGESIFSKLGGMFGGMSMPDMRDQAKPLITLGVIGLVAALVYLPSVLGGTNDKAIFTRFQEIYAQINQQRSSNPGSLKSLVPEVEQTVDDLEAAGAGASKPVKQQLFWAGKQCLIPLLNSPSPEKGPYDEKLQNYFSNVSKLISGEPLSQPGPEAGEGAPDDA